MHLIGRCSFTLKHSKKMVKVKMKSPWKRYVLLAFDLWHL